MEKSSRTQFSLCFLITVVAIAAALLSMQFVLRSGFRLHAVIGINVDEGIVFFFEENKGYGWPFIALLSDKSKYEYSGAFINLLLCTILSVLFANIVSKIFHRSGVEAPPSPPPPK